MGSIGNWGAGATPSRGNSAYYKDGEILWLKTGELNDGVIYNSEEKITQLALRECSLKLNKVGDVLIAMYGATIGKLGIVGQELTTNQACCGCTPYEGIYNYFLFYFLMANKTNFIKQGEGGAQPNISRDKLIRYLIPIPPYAEQLRIADRIEFVKPLLAQYDTASVKLASINRTLTGHLKKSILQYAIQGKLVPQNPGDEPASELLKRIEEEKSRLVKAGKIKRDKNASVIFKGEDNKYFEKKGNEVVLIEELLPFEIPCNWTWCTIGTLLQIQTGASFKKEQALSIQSGVRVLRGGNISPHNYLFKDDDIFIEKSLISEGILLKENDLITPAVTSIENIGKMARITQNYDDVTAGGFVFILRL